MSLDALSKLGQYGHHFEAASPSRFRNEFMKKFQKSKDDDTSTVNFNKRRNGEIKSDASKITIDMKSFDM